jgi:branched-chain amino acid transport system permease protein
MNGRSRFRLRPAQAAAAVAALAVFIVIPLGTGGFQTFQFAQVAAFVIVLIGLNVLTGYSGQISLGQGAFMAVGAYTTALLVHDLGVPWAATLPLAGLLAGVVGFLFGIPALRLRGIYLALATFALALAVTPVLNNYDHFTGGHVGITLAPIQAPLGIELSNEQWLYFVDWVIAAILFLPALWLVRTRTGRAWMAIRDSETAATANGINIAYYKTLAFGISAFYAGVGGALQMATVAYANPDNYQLTLSLQLLLGAVIGGLGYAWGPVFGALVVVWVPYFAEQAAGVYLGPISFGGKPDIIFGIALILILLFAPSGIAGLVQRGVGRLRPAAKPAPEPAVE